MNRLLAVTGYAEVGKSEVCKYLVEKYGCFRPLHIKTPMVDMADQLLQHMGITDKQERFDRLDGHRKNEPIIGFEPMSGRLILQVLGKQFRDGIDPTSKVFFNIWWANALDTAEPGDIILNESVRYLFEAVSVREQGGLVVEVTRKGKKPLNPEFEPHIPGDIVLPNDFATLPELHALIDDRIGPYLQNPELY